MRASASGTRRNPGEINDHPVATATRQNSAYRHRNMKDAFGNEGVLRFFPSNSFRGSRRLHDAYPRVTSALASTNQRHHMPAANDLRKGMAIKYNGNTAIVLEVHHRTPGNLRAFVQAIIRYINTGKSADVRFGSTDKVELVEIERKQLEFSYKDRNGYHFMDPENYETITLQENLIGDAKDYLVENLSVQVLYAQSKPVQVELPASVSLKVVESPEGLRGDTASNVTKPAVLESGKTINVPLFIKEGETVKIDTRTGAYMGRA
jgi:elongation factor P